MTNPVPDHGLLGSVPESAPLGSVPESVPLGGVTEFRLLGSVTVEHNGTQLPIGHARQQTVLTALLIDANTAISTDELIDRIWSTHPPHRPKDTLHTYLTRLRKTLPTTITRHGNSYQLTTPTTTIDLHHFRHLAKQAGSSSDVVAAALFDQAFALWRGTPFTGLDTPWLASVRAALLVERLAAELDHNDVRLRLGQHTALLTALTEQTTAHPLDERLAGQYLLALYRSGRQADALRHYQHTRQLLADELGVDPSDQLRRLHQQILTDEPAIRAPRLTGTPAAARFVPRQLPARPRSFVGRSGELDELSAILDDTARPGDAVLISTLSGSGGIGKTWLGLHWAYEHLDRFPDGQLFVNLRGYDPAGRPTTQDTAVRAFLSALGVRAASVPVTTAAALALYRDLVRDRHLLVVLDNAADTAQVEPLLPGSPTCTVLITSRGRLDGLDTKQVYLDVLPSTAARALLVARLGESRLTAEPEATDELLDCCAGLPLALSIVAGRALENPDFPLALLAAELRDEATRLALLDDDPVIGVRAVLSWSTAALRAEEATAFALLGLAPGPDISLPAAADLLGADEARTSDILTALERVSLIQQHSPGRFRMHDLVRLYATEQATGELPVDAALHRLLDFYRYTAAIGNRVLDPFWDSVEMDECGPRVHPVPLADNQAATAWFTAEEPNIQAAQRLAVRRGWHREVWHLAWHTMVFRRQKALVWERLHAAQDGLVAARALGEPTTLHLALRSLGASESQLGRHEAGIEHLNQALRIAADARDVEGQAHILHTLDLAVARTSDNVLGLDYAEQSLRLFRMLEQPVWVARKLNSVGWHATLLGQHERALVACTEALAITRAHGDRENEAATLDSLGTIAAALGDYRTAVTHYAEARTVMTDLGASYRIEDVLDHLGAAYRGLGQPERAREHWLEAQRLYRSHYRYSMADQVEAQLATLDKQSPQTLATPDNPTGQ